MEIYLDHEHNGAMVVYSEAEAAEWAKRGWLKRPSRNTPQKVMDAMGLKVADDGSVVPEPVLEPDPDQETEDLGEGVPEFPEGDDAPRRRPGRPRKDSA